MWYTVTDFVTTELEKFLVCHPDVGEFVPKK